MSILDSSITPPLVVLAVVAAVFLLARHLVKTLVIVIVVQLGLLVLFPSLLLSIARAVDTLRSLVGLHR
jgi:hypothetical protein